MCPIIPLSNRCLRLAAVTDRPDQTQTCEDNERLCRFRDMRLGWHHQSEMNR